MMNVDKEIEAVSKELDILREVEIRLLKLLNCLILKRHDKLWAEDINEEENE